MDNLTVTVSIPTYNRCGYLKEAIESVLAQTYTDFKLLITDNGSQDGTRELAEDYITRDSRIIYHRFPKNQGPALNWKYCLETPNTDLIALLLDDDLWLPEHLEYAVRAMKEIPSASLYGCAIEAFGDFPIGSISSQLPSWLAQCHERTTYNARENFVPMLMGTPLPVSSVVFRRSLLDGISLYMDDEFAPGDYFLLAQMALRGVMIFEPIVNTRYRWHAGNDCLRHAGSRASAAKSYYALRQLSIMAMREKALTPQMLVTEAANWPIAPLSTLVISLSALDAPPSLRWAALQLFKKRCDEGDDPQARRHFRIACKTGEWYLSVADIMERAIGCFWKPKGATTLRTCQ